MSLVSVIIIAGTGRPYLRHALGSLVAQDFTDWEAIVVEACHEPGDAARVREQLAEIKDDRVRLVPYDGLPCPPHPPYASRRWNCGLRHAVGEVACFLDDDDMKTPGWLAAMCGPILREADLDATVCRGTTIDAEGTRIGPVFGQHRLDREYLVVPNFVTMGQIAIRRSVLTALGDFDDFLGCSEDWELCLRFGAARRSWRAVDAESLKRDGVGNACYTPAVSSYTQDTLRHIIRKHGLAPDVCRACGEPFTDEQPDPRYVRALDGEGFRLWHSGCCSAFFAQADGRA